MRIYLAGPMRHIEEFNFPTFFAATAMLREKGHEVFSPAERDIKRHGTNITKGTTGDIKELDKHGFDIRVALAEDTTWICQNAEAIVLLPGWTFSKGTLAERALGVALNLKIITINELLPGFVSTHPTKLEVMAIMGNEDKKSPVYISPPLSGTKSTNPKDALGIRRAPMSTVPAPVMAAIGIAMLEGALKYGRHNYRSIGVRASVYYDATMRHLMAWWEGEDLDPDSGLSHIIKALASLVVLSDSGLQGNLTDDRPPRSPVGWYQELNFKVKALMEKYPDPVKPYTQV
jgi:Domain of unknown function (DUF5664)/Domain of unknown function (DUF4406)